MAPIVGTEWVVDATGCNAASLKDRVLLQSIVARIVDDLGLVVASPPLWHEFPEPGGITGLLLLAESHLACHTYPEHGIATFNLYCCRERPEWPWDEELRRALDAQDVTVRSLRRGSRVAELTAR